MEEVNFPTSNCRTKNRKQKYEIGKPTRKPAPAQISCIVGNETPAPPKKAPKINPVIAPAINPPTVAQIAYSAQVFGLNLIS